MASPLPESERIRSRGLVCLGQKPGLYPIGLKTGNTDEELRQGNAELEKAGVTIIGAADHTVTHCLYILDPDGNEL